MASSRLAVSHSGSEIGGGALVVGSSRGTVARAGKLQDVDAVLHDNVAITLLVWQSVDSHAFWLAVIS